MGITSIDKIKPACPDGCKKYAFDLYISANDYIFRKIALPLASGTVIILSGLSFMKLSRARLQTQLDSGLL
jgi:hypothetical protein